MSEAWIALLAAIFGGAGLKVIESAMSRSKDRSDIATQIRDELRTEIQGLRDELRIVEDRLDKSRNMYYAILHAFNMAKGYLLKLGAMDAVKELESMVDTTQAPGGPARAQAKMVTPKVETESKEE